MESAKEYFKNEFQLRMFLLEHHDASEFYLGSWQKNRQALPLLIWRGFLFVFSATIMVSSMVTFIIQSIFGYWFIYLTHWGLVLIVLTTGFGTAVSARCYLRGPIDSGLGLPWFVKTYWVLYNIAVPMALLITIFYWSLLYDSGVEEELNALLDIAVHGLNTLIVLLQLLSSRQVSRILHFHQPLLMATLYMIFGLIYYAAGGTDQKGHPWIYPVINWAQPGPTTVLVLLTGLMLLALHLLTVSLAAFRDASVKRLFGDNDDTPQPQEIVPLRQPNGHNDVPRV